MNSPIKLKNASIKLTNLFAFISFILIVVSLSKSYFLLLYIGMFSSILAICFLFSFFWFFKKEKEFFIDTKFDIIVERTRLSKNELMSLIEKNCRPITRKSVSVYLKELSRKIDKNKSKK